MAYGVRTVYVMAPIERSNRFNMRLSDEEQRMLDHLADGRGLTASDLLRTMIRDAYLASEPAKKPKRR